MPKKIELRVEAVNNYSKGIRKGDFLTLPRGVSGMVQLMEAKQTYLHITLVGGTKGRLPLGSEINVTREVPTDDEQNLFEMKHVERKVMENHEHYRKAILSGLNKLRETHKKRTEAGYLDPIDFALMADIKMDEMHWAIYETVRVFMVELMTDENTPEHGAAVRAVMRVRHQLERDLIGRSSRALSRSTSVISNLEEDMRREAAVKFLDESKWWGVEEVWERVGTVLF